MYRGQATWEQSELVTCENVSKGGHHHGEQPTQPLPFASSSASMDAVVSLKSDQSPSALNTTTASATDSSTPPAVLRVGQDSTDEVY